MRREAEGASEANSDLPRYINGYRLERQLDRGSFGEIYLGVNDAGSSGGANRPREAAIKMEPTWAEHRQLRHEIEVYKELANDDRPRSGIAQIYESGYAGEDHFLIMELLGPNLEDLYNACDRTWSQTTIARLACQMVCFQKSRPKYRFLSSNFCIRNT